MVVRERTISQSPAALSPFRLLGQHHLSYSLSALLVSMGHQKRYLSCVTIKMAGGVHTLKHNSVSCNPARWWWKPVTDGWESPSPCKSHRDCVEGDSKLKSGQGPVLQAFRWASLVGHLSRINLSCRSASLAFPGGQAQAAGPSAISVRQESIQTAVHKAFWETSNPFISSCTTANATSIEL